MNLTTDLYEHQKRCVEKLRKIKIGALYMEMGTGKTRTTLELIKLRLDAGKINHVLWLCPCSVKESLRRDLLKHTDDISMITICGIETLSSSIKVNLELLELVKSKNCYLIVDESNLVKNQRAYRTKNIIRLSEFCTYKLILNGTPISRNEADLYAQWYILDWRILGYKSYWSFAANHIQYDEAVRGKIVKCLNVNYLVKKIAPYSYQVKKDECIDLPPKTYEIDYYELTQEQEKCYSNVADKLMFSVDEFKPYTIYKLFTALQNVISGYNVEIDKNLNMIKSPMFKNPKDNPRIKTLLDILKQIDGKILIFCKYTQEIKDICEVLEDEAVPFYGELNQKERNKNLELFKNDKQYLVANKTCAGYGLNLQFCNYVIYYSNDWDYATRAQSEDRVHRIGQNKNVHYIDICADDTLDKRILKCLSRKERLVDNFKDGIEEEKDNKVSYIERFIYKKNYKGKLKNKGSEMIEVKIIEELEEGKS